MAGKAIFNRQRARAGASLAVTARGSCGFVCRSCRATCIGRGITHVRTVDNTDFVSSGVSGIGAAGTGTISVSGVTGSVTKALLFWHGINTSSAGAVYGSATPSVNSVAVVGASRGDAGNNCWGPGSSRTYVADVTSLVPGNGAYDLAGMASTPGDDANGESLIVFFNDGNPANNRDVVLFEGNDSNFPQGYPGDDEGWHRRVARHRPAGRRNRRPSAARGRWPGLRTTRRWRHRGERPGWRPHHPGSARGWSLGRHHAPDAGHFRRSMARCTTSSRSTSRRPSSARRQHRPHRPHRDQRLPRPGRRARSICPSVRPRPHPRSCSINDVTLSEGNAGPPTSPSM